MPGKGQAMGHLEHRRPRKGAKEVETTYHLPAKESRRRGPGAAGGVGSCAATSEQTRLNRAICAAADRRDTDAVLDLVQTKQSRMNLVNLSTAFHRLARLAAEDKLPCWSREDPRTATLQQRIKALLTQMRNTPDCEPHPRCLSTIAWACGRLQEYDLEVMKVISELAVRWISLFKPFELANLLWGFAKLQIGCSGALFRAAQDQICADMSSFSTRSISLVAWAFATARPQPCARLLRKAAEAFVGSVDTADEKPVSIANLVWALATMAVHPKSEVLREIGDAAAVALHNFKANELSITLWAFARLSCCHEGLFEAAAHRLCREKSLRSEIHSQGIANILWAFARQAASGGTSATPNLAHVLPTLLPTCLRLLPQLNPMEFSSVVSAASKLAMHWGTRGAAEQILLAAAAGPGSDVSYLSQFSNQAVANVLSAYGSFFESQPLTSDACCALVAHLEQICVERGLELEHQSVLAAMWGPDPLAGATDLDPAAVVALETLCAGVGACQRSECSPLEVDMSMGAAVQALAGYIEALPAMPQMHVFDPQEPAYLPLPQPLPWAGFEHDVSILACAQDEPAALHAALLASWQSYTVPLPPGIDLDEKAQAEEQTTAVPDSEGELVSLSIVPEFSYVEEGDDKADTSVVIAFEVESLGSHKELQILVEACTLMECREHVSFPVDAEGMYKIALPAKDGDWEVRITARGAQGQLVAEALQIPFQGLLSGELAVNETEVEGDVEGRGPFCIRGPGDNSDLVSTCASIDGAGPSSDDAPDAEAFCESGNGSVSRPASPLTGAGSDRQAAEATLAA